MLCRIPWSVWCLSCLWCCCLLWSGFAVIFYLRDALKWSLVRLAVQHHTSMCYFPMFVSVQCWAVGQNSVRCWAKQSLLSNGCRGIFYRLHFVYVSCYLYWRWVGAWWTVSFSFSVVIAAYVGKRSICIKLIWLFFVLVQCYESCIIILLNCHCVCSLSFIC